MDGEEYQITLDAYEKLKDLFMKAYPEEGCAVLLGNRRSYLIDEVLGTENCAPEDERRDYFAIDPLKLIGIESMAEEMNKDLMGFAHSHPDAEPFPSRDDMIHMIPETVNLIMTTDPRREGRFRAFTKNTLTEDVIGISIGIITEE